jgi:transcriptional regulator with XRE-family HTH domain
MNQAAQNERMSEYGARLKQAMELNGWTNQAALARAIGVQKATINQVLTDDAEKTQTKYLNALNSARVARLLNVDHHWLATGEGDPRTDLMSERMALSPKAVYIGEKLDAIEDPQKRARAYALIVQILEFGGSDPPPTPPPGDGPSTAPRQGQ